MLLNAVIGSNGSVAGIGFENCSARQPSSRTDPLSPAMTGSLRDAQFTSRHKPFVAGFKVPFADDDYLEMPARYLPLNCTSDGHRIDGGIP